MSLKRTIVTMKNMPNIYVFSTSYNNNNRTDAHIYLGKAFKNIVLHLPVRTPFEWCPVCHQCVYHVYRNLELGRFCR